MSNQKTGPTGPAYLHDENNSQRSSYYNNGYTGYTGPKYEPPRQRKQSQENASDLQESIYRSQLREQNRQRKKEALALLLFGAFVGSFITYMLTLIK